MGCFLFKAGFGFMLPAIFSSFFNLHFMVRITQSLRNSLREQSLIGKTEELQKRHYIAGGKTNGKQQYKWRQNGTAALAAPPLKSINFPKKK